MKVALFVTCLADHYLADAAADTVRLLRHVGCEVEFPPQQTCCGQPAHNVGQVREAKAMAEHTLSVFREAEAIVVPSGSCAAMVKHTYVTLFDSSDSRAAALSKKTFELGEFLVNHLGVQALRSALGSGLAGRRVAVHQGCHALRELRLVDEPTLLLEGVGAEVVPWPAQEECCGFGGLFSVKMPDVSAAMADRKLDTLPEVDWIVTGDGGCLLHLDGRAQARDTKHAFRHLASALWEGVRGGP